ncbi:MAG: hypothetical protein UU93_C0012G0001 [Candidatus Amesbacteria bacterium GW2011_GWA2_42_12]|uniref:Uncharacterized protein n=1 Tax=Candidatus Amesbacteria bacterium GW2011_GWA2_42_12 TaxID=1618356 RepID=A0A0G0Y5K3_9BACT|nr:MAG: hypothetical protein UU93_C0012G0001 [Candidatus Amesbacteria bacterium GW2011_GWA2_42_12]
MVQSCHDRDRIVIFVLGWLGLGIGTVVLGLFGVWK